METRQAPDNIGHVSDRSCRCRGFLTTTKKSPPLPFPLRTCPAIRTNQALAGACSRNGVWGRLRPRVPAEPRAKRNTSCFSLMRGYTRINRHLVDLRALAGEELNQLGTDYAYGAAD